MPGIPPPIGGILDSDFPEAITSSILKIIIATSDAELIACDFIKGGQDVFITGSTGTGKSYIATAIGQQACLLGYKVLYASTSKLLSVLKMAKAIFKAVFEKI